MLELDGLPYTDGFEGSDGILSSRNDAALSHEVCRHLNEHAKFQQTRTWDAQTWIHEFGDGYACRLHRFIPNNWSPFYEQGERIILALYESIAEHADARQATARADFAWCPQTLVIGRECYRLFAVRDVSEVPVVPFDHKPALAIDAFRRARAELETESATFGKGLRGLFARICQR